MSTKSSVTSVAASTSGSLDLTVGGKVFITLDVAPSVSLNLTGGTPTLKLSDGGVATYNAAASTAGALVFDYTVSAGQTSSALAITSASLNGATVNGGGTLDFTKATGVTLTASNEAHTQTGHVLIDTTAPTASIASATSPSGTDLGAGKTVTITVAFSEDVTVTGKPALTLNDGGSATYASGSGSTKLVFTYTVAAGQNTDDLSVTGVALPTGAAVQDAAGNAANFSGADGALPGSIVVDTAAPTVSSVSAPSGAYNAAKVVPITVTFDEAVKVTGTPVLKLNDGGTAKYVSGSGSDALVFDYTVASGQNTAALEPAGITLSGGTIKDLAGNAASLGGAATTLTVTGSGTAVIIDTTPPVVTEALADDTGASGTDNVTFDPTLAGTSDPNAVVTFTEGTRVLGTTTANASGAWTFLPTLAEGLVEGSNKVVASETDAAGNTGTASLTFTLQTIPPTISITSVNTSGGDDIDAGKTVTITVASSEPVTVTGTPALKLNDGGSATYVAAKSTASSLVFTYTVAAGQNTSALAVTGVALTGAAVTDAAGNAANFSGTYGVLAGPIVVDTKAPTVIGVSAPAGDYNAGKLVPISVTFSDPMTVTGAPVLALNDGGTATYDPTHSSGATLVFDYTVRQGQNALALEPSGITLGSATIKDIAGNAADLSGVATVLTPTGGTSVIIDTEVPLVTEALANNTGQAPNDTYDPTLTGVADPNATVIFTEGTKVLGTTTADASGDWTFLPTRAEGLVPGPNTVVASDTDAAGNTGTASLTFTLDTDNPTITAASVPTESASLKVGTVVPVTLTFNEKVYLSGSGTPSIALNNGATATYVSGKGTDNLVFDYTVTKGSTQNTTGLEVTGLNLPGTSLITDFGGNPVSFDAISVTCFMPGTLIRTPQGERAVETLAEGELVLTLDGSAQPVLWLGRQTISRSFADPLRVLPIRIAAGALADNMPVRDLLVSPDHALLVDGVLVQAGALVNGTSIRREEHVPTVFTYYHVELADHALLFAEGVPAESFVDNVDRLGFDNWDEHLARHPQGRSTAELPMPRAKSSRQVPAATRARLAGRAAGTTVAAA